MDPRLVNNPPAINEMTYREMRELAYAGFGVFHDEAIIPTIKKNIPISIKNTNFPEKRELLFYLKEILMEMKLQVFQVQMVLLDYISINI